MVIRSTIDPTNPAASNPMGRAMMKRRRELETRDERFNPKNRTQKIRKPATSPEGMAITKRALISKKKT